ncbi:hypothetical protein KR018_010334, partial [Drosophila ironensis]
VFLILFLNWAKSIPISFDPAVVPELRFEGVLVVPESNKYYLRIDNLDGAVREETVEETAPGLFLVQGSWKERFPGGNSLKVTYSAGPNGNVAKYTYGEDQSDVQHLPAVVLKVAAG